MNTLRTFQSINFSCLWLVLFVPCLRQLPIPGLGRSPGEGKGYPLQYSGLENSMDYTVCGVAKSWPRLSHFHFHFVPEGEGKTWAGGSLQAGCLWKPEGGMNHQKDSAALPAERT